MDTNYKTKPAEHEIVLSIRLTREQHAQLKALAARENRSMSQQIRHVIAREIDTPVAA